MSFLRRNIFLYAFIVLVISSCKDYDEYRIDSAFDEYLQRFLSAASQYGYNFDVKSTGLIIEFANLPSGTAGLTHFENPVRIQIDRTYWNEISSSANADLMKEELIFHELGHGLLDRDHLNSCFQNGEWVSLMRGGTKVDGRTWNVNYKGLRKSYYISELFNKKVAVPDFCSLILPVDTSGYVSKLLLNFNNDSDNKWKLVDNSQYKTSLENGAFRFESKISQVYLVFLSTGINVQSDFLFEMNLYYAGNDNTAKYGILFGYVPATSSGMHDPVGYLSINNASKMFPGNRSFYSYYTELERNSVVPYGYNKLKVVKQNKIIYYFINDHYCYSTEMDIDTSGYNFGFEVPAKAVVYADNFRIAQRGSTQQAVRGVSTSVIEFECKPVDPVKSIMSNK